MRHHLNTDTVIDAAPDAVWSILTDFGAYPSWNPFITSLDGRLAIGERLTVRIAAPGGKTMTFRPRVIRVEPGRSFAWHGRLLVPGLFDGRHHFELEAAGSGTRLRHFEEFSGWLVRPLRRSLDRDTRAGFESMNAALKRRAESAGPS